ncbi:flavodoxin [Leuconostoc mesenteroides]|uniref:flavodoxin n=1 Tax=Leuconostoc mesenteroides TaxID=1245 RepID=UPI0021A8F781|nr:flavodoxin [Leuconostoc mesenteroides]
MKMPVLKLKNPLPDVSGYNTVFVGAPVWWGDYPMVVYTFLDAVDLNGKNVVPFATSEGSGLVNIQMQKSWKVTLNVVKMLRTDVLASSQMLIDG